MNELIEEDDKIYVTNRLLEVFEKIEIERIGMGTHEKFHAMLGEFKQKYLNK